MEHEEPEATEGAEAIPNAPGPPKAMTRTESRLRKLAGKKEPYDGPLVAVGRAWVSRDGRAHLFAARFLDFAVLTPDHLVLCSTGFFTRRPRRCVFRESLGRIDVSPRGAEPFHTVRVVGNFSRPIRLELRPNEAGLTFARELLAGTRSKPASSPTETAEQPASTTAADASDGNLAQS